MFLSSVSLCMRQPGRIANQRMFLLNYSQNVYFVSSEFICTLQGKVMCRYTRLRLRIPHIQSEDVIKSLLHYFIFRDVRVIRIIIKQRRAGTTTMLYDHPVNINSNKCSHRGITIIYGSN